MKNVKSWLLPTTPSKICSTLARIYYIYITGPMEVLFVFSMEDTAGYLYADDTCRISPFISLE